MCRKKKKNEREIPSGAEEKNMRESVIASIDDILLDWTMPSFVTKDSNPDETAKNEQAIKANLNKARAILAKMFLPRGDARVYAYAKKISEAFVHFENKDSRFETGSQAAIVAASEQILTYTKAWENL